MHQKLLIAWNMVTFYYSLRSKALPDCVTNVNEYVYKFDKSKLYLYVFKINKWVKQGVCISPTHFSLYINNHINILLQNNIGCHYALHYMRIYGNM